MAVLGIDIGGTGIKGAPVDVSTGSLTAERFRIPTPQPATVEACLDVIAQVVEQFSWQGAIGIAFPGVVVNGVIRTAVNLDASWLGADLPALVTDRVGCPAVAVNDADAAGVAEAHHGVARGVPGVVLMLTFGTGVGSALLVDGRLVPNTELGHLELRGKDAEKRVAESVRERKGWSWKKWARRVDPYLAMVERLFSPTLIVVGGGIAKAPEKFLPLLEVSTPVRAAALANEAGIVGAAMVAHHTHEQPAAASAAASSPARRAPRTRKTAATATATAAPATGA